MERICRYAGLCLSLLAGLGLAGQGLAGQAQEQPRQQHVGRVLDWSYHHVILSGGLPQSS
jgi:hypothetical protein